MRTNAFSANFDIVNEIVLHSLVNLMLRENRISNNFFFVFIQVIKKHAIKNDQR